MECAFARKLDRLQNKFIADIVSCCNKRTKRNAFVANPEAALGMIFGKEKRICPKKQFLVLCQMGLI